jgi:nucleotide-binding universal stress UspA family protein
VRALAEKAGVEFEELIVLGSEGKSRMEHTLLGSVSEEVLRHANRTVLVVGGHPEGESP